MKLVQKTLLAEGMTCAACAKAIERNLSKMEGVTSAAVNYASEKVTIEYDEEKVSLDDMVTRITKLGYGLKEENHLREISIPIEGMT
ncbi:copper chaperone CopZ [Alkaliphilus hydrothermalis]|uniref:Copper chaperone CopZ n=2 Tax=Alkaliphilus hydrothermalis TaxID=1482730 RepID=A0ABS2NP33_9FIRM|nr:copper chaperone CopZ [Alkaliphilus hydrothermalis]